MAKTSKTSCSSVRARARSSHHPILVGCLVGFVLSAVMYFSVYLLSLSSSSSSSLLLHDLRVTVLTVAMYLNEVLYIAVCCVLASLLVRPDCTTRTVMSLRRKALTMMLGSRFFSFCCSNTPSKKDRSSHGSSQPVVDWNYSPAAGSTAAASGCSSSTCSPRQLFEYLVLFEGGLLLGSSVMALLVETFTINLMMAASSSSSSSAAGSMPMSMTTTVQQINNDGVVGAGVGAGADVGIGAAVVSLLLPTRSLWRFLVTNAVNTVACFAMMYVVKKHHRQYNGNDESSSSRRRRRRPHHNRRCNRHRHFEFNGDGEDDCGCDGDEWWIGDMKNNGGGRGDTESTTSTDSSVGSSFHGDDFYEMDVEDDNNNNNGGGCGDNDDDVVDDDDAGGVDMPSLQWLLRTTSTPADCELSPSSSPST